MSWSRCDRAALVGAVALSIACGAATAEPAWCPGSSGDHANEVPRYDHIFVIIAENHGYAQIIGNPNAPNLNRLADGLRLGDPVLQRGASQQGELHRDARRRHVRHPRRRRLLLPAGSTGRFPASRPTRSALCRPHRDGAQPDGPAGRAPSHLEGLHESLPAPGSKAVYYPTSGIRCAANRPSSMR